MSAFTAVGNFFAVDGNFLCRRSNFVAFAVGNRRHSAANHQPAVFARYQNVAVRKFDAGNNFFVDVYAVAFAVAGEYRVAAVVVVNVFLVGAENNFRIEILVDKVAQEQIARRIFGAVAGARDKSHAFIQSRITFGKVMHVFSVYVVVVVALYQISNALGEVFRHGVLDRAAAEHDGVNHFVRQNSVEV